MDPVLSFSGKGEKHVCRTYTLSTNSHRLKFQAIELIPQCKALIHRFCSVLQVVCNSLGVCN